jgi:hypothetical protein
MQTRRRRGRCAEFKTESPGLLATATFSAIACFAIVHRAILTSLLTARLVRRETYCANRGCQDRQQDFEMILHNQPSPATFAKASQKDKNAQARRLPCDDSSGSLS